MVSMNDQLSALMDGELDDAESRQIYTSLARDPESRRAWHDYHLLGAALRNEPYLATDLTAKVMAALETEPVVLAPRNLSRSGRADKGHGWMALAASVAGVVFVGWIALAPPSSSTTAGAVVASMKKPPVVVAESGTMQAARLQEYLVAHQAHSPSMSPQGGTRYVRTVSAQRMEGGR
jgi:sigma-E factor negative regulatory protein RseA